MDSFVRLVATLSRASGVLAAALILVSVFVVCQMVLARYALGHPTTWQTEFVIYSLVATTLVGSPYVLLHRGHVNMDIVVLYSGQRLRFWLALAAGLISLAFCLLLFFYGVHFWYEAWSRGWRSDTITRVPLWIPYLALPLGMGLLVLQLVAELGCLLTGRTRPFGLPPKGSGPPGVLHATPAEPFASELEPHP
ncbi:MAG TPA: TRAP transporter small permease [Geminicoccaceae bacterium]|nr:TRAP transporter small permease [Geminicoccaceae bacterium]